jgi:hypothetical protein
MSLIVRPAGLVDASHARVVPVSYLSKFYSQSKISSTNPSVVPIKGVGNPVLESTNAVPIPQQK